MLKKFTFATFAVLCAVLAFVKPASAELSMAYESVQFEYTQQDDTGAAGGGLGICLFWLCF